MRPTVVLQRHGPWSMTPKNGAEEMLPMNASKPFEIEPKPEIATLPRWNRSEAIHHVHAAVRDHHEVNPLVEKR